MEMRLGRFRILFQKKGSATTMRWFSISIGYETSKFRARKKKIRQKKKEKS